MNRLASGAIAGAAGTIALDIATYSDMALSGRASSGMPAEIIRRIAAGAGFDPLAKPDGEADDRTKSRRQAFGAISGYAIGVATGTLCGGLAPVTGRLPSWAMAFAMGAFVGISGWLRDAVPHLVYGIVTALVFAALDSPQPPR